MSEKYFQHPDRFPKNVPGPFYTLRAINRDGSCFGDCLACGVPEEQAPALLAPLTDTNADTYFLRQPETAEEVEQACRAIEVCCTNALRYGVCDPRILMRLKKTDCCDHSVSESKVEPGLMVVTKPVRPPIRKWWELWK